MTIHVAENYLDSYLWRRQLVPKGLKPLACAALKIAALTVQNKTISEEEMKA
jgi:hypothetical protein